VIVRETDGQLLLITQPDHAHLSRRVMERCVPLSTRLRRDAIVRAIGEHDNGWAEVDAAPLVDPDRRTVFDFTTMPFEVVHGVWRRGISRLAGDTWVAALVAHHAVSVYERRRPNPDWVPFFAEMEATRDRFLGSAGAPLDELVADYAFVRLGDLISLAFCVGQAEEYRTAGWSVRRSGTRVVVTPDAFGGETVPIEIPAKEIRNRPFHSDADARAALNDADIVTLRGEVAGS
jgi:hypothetical protein